MFERLDIPQTACWSKIVFDCQCSINLHSTMFQLTFRLLNQWPGKGSRTCLGSMNSFTQLKLHCYVSRHLPSLNYKVVFSEGSVVLYYPPYITYLIFVHIYKILKSRNFSRLFDWTRCNFIYMYTGSNRDSIASTCILALKTVMMGEHFLKIGAVYLVLVRCIGLNPSDTRDST